MGKKKLNDYYSCILSILDMLKLHDNAKDD